MKKIYYAHCQAIYNTPQEQRDIETLKLLGFDVVNPNEPKHQKAVAELKKKSENNPFLKANYNVMNYFYDLVKTCDALAFRALPDGSIPAGVGGELSNLIFKGAFSIPVIELPSGIKRRVLTVEQTREYLEEVGQR